MTGCNSWDRGLDVVLEGDAVRVRDTDTLRRLAEAWRTKWDGSWTFDVGEEGFQNPDTGDPVPVFAVAPRKVLAFRKGDFSHTSHRPQAAGSPGT